MSAEAFFDTNVLFYLIGSDRRKAARASDLLAAGGTISVQVLNEFANAARRKAGMNWSELREVLDVVRRVCIVRPVDVATHDRGLAIAERYGFSLYDSMIVAAAIESRCTRLWSEDLQNGQSIGSLLISDPFAQPA